MYLCVCVCYKDPKVWGYPQLYREFKVSLGYMKPYHLPLPQIPFRIEHLENSGPISETVAFELGNYVSKVDNTPSSPGQPQTLGIPPSTSLSQMLGLQMSATVPEAHHF